MPSALKIPVVLLFLLSACKTTVTTKGSCGDGFLDPGEACDGSELSVSECSALGWHFQSGPILCNADCTLNVQVCSGRCGDGELQTDAGEHCEGTNLNGQSCQLLSLGGGTLTCDGECHFDASGCETSAVCGDGTIHEPFEDCEGDDLQGATCQSLGYHGGQLLCGLDCRFDIEPCTAFGRCGDGTIQTLYGEVCEGDDLQEETCAGLGWYGGQLLCGNDCTYDLSGCEAVGRCGDGVIQTEQGEECDGANLGGFSCDLDTAFHGGLAVCGDDCRLDLSACEATGYCGDGVYQEGYEACDGTVIPGGASCTLLGYYGDLQRCTAACTLDISPCVAAGRCGDGIRQMVYEACEGGDLGGNTCMYFDYYGGTLACTADCLYDLTSCIAAGTCGDGIIQNGEVCDGGNLDGNTCESFSYTSGTLGCSNTCTQFDTTNCVE